jgi:hypothetical protein
METLEHTYHLICTQGPDRATVHVVNRRNNKQLATFQGKTKDDAMGKARKWYANQPYPRPPREEDSQEVQLERENRELRQRLERAETTAAQATKPETQKPKAEKPATAEPASKSAK